MAIQTVNLGAAANLYNHPGFRELEQFGKLLIASLE